MLFFAIIARVIDAATIRQNVYLAEMAGCGGPGCGCLPCSIGEEE